MTAWTRRSFLALSPWMAIPVSVLTPRAATSRPVASDQAADTQAAPAALAHFPEQDPALVREVVGASHSDLDRVTRLVDARPALARATWDWGFGDWESALGAASHVGRRDIAEYLISKGARIDLFAAAMLGQLDVVRAIIASSPGIQRTRGPHSITLLSHARAGGAQARPVYDYLTTVEGADDRPSLPIAPGERDRLVGSYRYGSGQADRLDVRVSREMLTIAKAGGSARNLLHLGALVFYPVGAEAVRVQFTTVGGRPALVVQDGDVRVDAVRTEA